MRHDAMMGMSKDELDAYAGVLGIDVTGKRTVAAKVAAIEDRRERSAEVDVLGMTVAIPVKRLHDKRVSDLWNRRPMTDEDAAALLRLLLGDGQMEALCERATDDDGTVDNDALAHAMATVLGADELKNY